MKSKLAWILVWSVCVIVALIAAQLAVEKPNYVVCVAGPTAILAIIWAMIG
jgi:hypothetical protein